MKTYAVVAAVVALAMSLALALQLTTRAQDARVAPAFEGRAPTKPVETNTKTKQSVTVPVTKTTQTVEVVAK